MPESRTVVCPVESCGAILNVRGNSRFRHCGKEFWIKDCLANLPLATREQTKGLLVETPEETGFFVRQRQEKEEDEDENDEGTIEIVD